MLLLDFTFEKQNISRIHERVYGRVYALFYGIWSMRWVLCIVCCVCNIPIHDHSNKTTANNSCILYIRKQITNNK